MTEKYKVPLKTFFRIVNWLDSSIPSDFRNLKQEDIVINISHEDGSRYISICLSSPEINTLIMFSGSMQATPSPLVCWLLFAAAEIKGTITYHDLHQHHPIVSQDPDAILHIAILNNKWVIVSEIEAPLHEVQFFLADPKDLYSHICIFNNHPWEIYNKKENNKTMDNNNICCTLNGYSFANINTSTTTPKPAFDCGPASTNQIRLSPKGPAVSKNGTDWFVHDINQNKTINVTGYTLAVDNFFYKIPVSPKKLSAGDIILHNNTPVIINETYNDAVTAIDPCASEEKTIFPVENIFGYSYVTKIVPIADIADDSTSEDKPFGNFGKIMLMQSLFSGDKKIDPMMFMMLSKSKDNPFSDIFDF